MKAKKPPVRFAKWITFIWKEKGFPFIEKPVDASVGGPLWVAKVQVRSEKLGAYITNAVVVPEDASFASGVGILILTKDAKLPEPEVVDHHIAICATTACLCGLMTPEQVSIVLTKIRERCPPVDEWRQDSTEGFAQ